MKVRGLSAAVGVILVTWCASWAQQLPTSAKVETLPLELTAPDRFQVPAVLEPLRRVTIVATADGVVRAIGASVGASVREGQEVAELDRAEAAARLKIAQANVKEAEATLKSNPSNRVVAEAQLEAAQARAEIARLELDRCTLRAPFSGRILDTPVFPGQYVAKGTTIAELADTSALRALVPLDRSTATLDASVNLSVEGQAVSGKIKATLPLPDAFAPLRELATAYTAAWVVVPNTKNELDPGQRVFSSALPSAPIATIASRALQKADDPKSGASKIQVIRNEYVTNVPVRVLGHPAPERVQVSGALRPTDALIVSSSVPLLAGTLIRFSGASGTGAVEAKSPNPAESGSVADIAPPRGSASGAAGAAAPKGRTPSRTATRPPAAAGKPATKSASGTVPF